MCSGGIIHQGLEIFCIDKNWKMLKSFATDKNNKPFFLKVHEKSL